MGFVANPWDPAPAEPVPPRRPEKKEKRKNGGSSGPAKCPLCGVKFRAETHKLALAQVKAHLQSEHRSPAEPMPSRARGQRHFTERVRSVVRGGLPGQGKKR